MGRRGMSRMRIQWRRVALAAVLTTGAVQAQRVAEEPFLTGATPGLGEYTVGASVVGSSPTVTGFDSLDAWADESGGAADAWLPAADGLTYPGLASSGGRLTWDTSAGAKVSSAERRVMRDTSISSPTADDTIYVSALICVHDSFPSKVVVHFHRSGFPAPSSVWLEFVLTSAGFQVIKENETDRDVFSATDLQGNGPTVGTTNLFVARVTEGGGSDVLEAWFNPTLGAGTPGSSGTAVNGLISGSEYVSGVTIYADAQNESVSVDEIRIGHSFADVTPAPSAPPAPLYSDRDYKRDITFDGYTGAETLVAFPALVTFEEGVDGFSYAQLGAPETGGDLRFADADEVTELPYEIDLWDSNGVSYVWVQVPALTNGARVLAYWGHGSETNPPVAATNGSVWSGDFDAVFHLEDEAGSTVTDAQIPRSNGSLVNGAARTTAGLIGGAAEFFGDDERVNNDVSKNFGSTGYTVGLWARADVLAQPTFSGLFSSGPGTTGFQLSYGSGSFGDPNSTWTYWTTADAVIGPASTDWVFVVARCAGSGSDVETLWNAAPAGTATDERLSFARYDIGINRGENKAFDGVIDEVRIAATARSDDWLRAEFLTVVSNDVFAAYGPAIPAVADVLNVTNGAGVAGITSNQAWLAGSLLATGGSPAQVSVYWGATDAHPSLSGWDGTNHFGYVGVSLPAAYSNLATDLQPNTLYTYRYYATNDAGDVAWSPPVTFRTWGGLPGVTNLGAEPGLTSALVSGTLTNGADADLRIAWGTSPGGAATTNFVGAQTQAASFSAPLSGLAPRTTYYCRWLASNANGTAESDLQSFTTAFDHYVAPAAAGLGNGSDWGNAFGSIQDAINAVANAEDVIFVKEGSHVLTSQLDVSGFAALSIRGGYAGNTTGGLPGTAGGDTVITRSGTLRLLYGADTTVTVERVTFDDGRLGDVEQGAGLSLTGSVVTLRDVTVSNCRLERDGKGSGIFLDNCTATLSNCVILANQVYKTGDNGSGWGAGIHAVNGSLSIRDSRFASNNMVRGASGNHTYFRGGALYAEGTALDVQGTTFEGNRVEARGGGSYNAWAYGGCLYLTGGTATFDDCLFTNNYAQALSSANGGSWGGVVYATDVAPLVLRDCDFADNYGYAEATEATGGQLYIIGADAETLVDASTFLRGVPSFLQAASSSAGELYFADGAVTFVHSAVQQALRGGIRLASGSLTATNLLVAACGGDGVTVSGGTAELVNLTAADNAGWGVREDGGTVDVLNSIAWGNLSGGLSLSGGTVNYTYAQEAHAGTANGTADPRLVYGYYLAVNGLQGQTADSPCFGIGSGSSASLGLDARTVRTDGAVDGGTVDLGWHAGAGLSGAVMDRRELYVDVTLGSDANDGLAAGAGNALQTIGAALRAAINGSTIHLAAGDYTDATESYPLSVQTPNVTLQGAGRDTTTIAGDDAERVLSLIGSGPVTIADVTVRDGYGGNNGAGSGLASLGSWPVLRDARVGPNRITLTGGFQHGYGAGIFAREGAIELQDTVLVSNRIAKADNNGGKRLYGGGLHVWDAQLRATNATFEANWVTSTTSGDIVYGGGVYLQGADARFEDCLFTNNYAQGYRYAYGGAVAVDDATQLVLARCLAVGNYGTHNTSNPTQETRGGALSLSGAAVEAVVDASTLRDNGDGATSYGDVYLDGGALAMTNTIVAGNGGVGVRVIAGSLEGVNVTVANQTGYGLTNAAAASLRSSIVWGNAGGGLDGTVTVDYSTVQGAPLVAGTDNLNVDPLFVDAAGRDYHLMSEEESWHNAAAGWVTDASHSPAIDTGDPADTRWALEPVPNGSRINMGAFGGTDRASKFHAVAAADPPVVTNLGAALVRRDEATLSAEVLEGGLCSTWMQYWPVGGATGIVDTGVQNANFATVVGSLTPGTTYGFRAMASNETDTTYSGVQTFTTRPAGPVDWYVSTNGVATEATNWPSAFTSIQTALDLSAPGDTIRMKAGTWALTAPLSFEDGMGVTIEGGYGGDEVGGLPGALTNAPTVITRAAATFIRLLNASDSTVTVRRVTLRGGTLKNSIEGGSARGGGLWVSNSVLRLDAVVLEENEIQKDIDSAAARGGAVHAMDSTLVLLDCTVYSNRLRATTGNHTYLYGGAVYADESIVTASNSVFAMNYVHAGSGSGEHGFGQGGAFRLAGGSLELVNCLFATNWCYAKYDAEDTRGNSRGGAVYAEDVAPLTVVSNTFEHNYSYADPTGDEHDPRGGVVFLAGPSLSAAFDDSSAISNTAAQTYVSGGFWLNDGTADLTRQLLAHGEGPAFTVAGGVATLVNCTIADHTGWGITNGGGTVSVRNTIAWNNTAGGIHDADTVTYTLSQEAHVGVGNLVDDPLFVYASAADYHVQSKGGSWHGGAWLADAQQSPAIDAGDPADPHALEPSPNGGRVNLGVYGNTVQASKSSFPGSLFLLR